MVATVEDDRITKLRPDPDHPLSKGYACPKGIAMLDVQNDPDRVLHPLKKGPDGEFAISDERLIQTISEAAEIMPELFAKLKTDEPANALEAGMTAALVNGVSRRVQRRRLAA